MVNIYSENYIVVTHVAKLVFFVVQRVSEAVW